jgi:hypothetical protein
MSQAKYKLPINPVIPFKIRPQDILYPKRGYKIDYRLAVESGKFCDYDSFIIDIAERGILAECLWLAFDESRYPTDEKDLYVFMRRWGLLGDRENRTFKSIANEIGLVQCCYEEQYVKARIHRAYHRFTGACSRVKDTWDYDYDLYQEAKRDIGVIGTAIAMKISEILGSPFTSLTLLINGIIYIVIAIILERRQVREG